MGITTQTKKEKGFLVIIDIERCKGCGLCIAFCPKKELKFSDKNNKKGYPYPEFRGTDCIGCLRCGLICPETAITILRKSRKKEKGKGL